MAIYEVKVTGWESVEADSAYEAAEKFDQMMREGYKVSDLRWKTVSTGDEDEENDHGC